VDPTGRAPEGAAAVRGLGRFGVSEAGKEEGMTRGAGWGATWLGGGVTSTEGLLVVRAFWFDMTMVPLPSVDRWTPAKAVSDKKTVLPAQMSTRLSKILPLLAFSSAAALRGVILFLKTLKAYPNFN